MQTNAPVQLDENHPLLVGKSELFLQACKQSGVPVIEVKLVQESHSGIS
jgi:hypothetical protein